VEDVPSETKGVIMTPRGLALVWKGRSYSVAAGGEDEPAWHDVERYGEFAEKLGPVGFGNRGFDEHVGMGR